jgi:hypothetical protein
MKNITESGAHVGLRSSGDETKMRRKLRSWGTELRWKGFPTADQRTKRRIGRATIEKPNTTERDAK